MTYLEFIEKFERCDYEDRHKDTRGLCRHHIEPKTVQKRLYGEVINEECVIVSYADHIRCHYYYWLEHKEDYLHAMALCMMIKTNLKELENLAEDDINKIIEEVGNIDYRTEEYRKRISEKTKKYFESEENRKRASEAVKGEKNPNFGKPHSADWRKKISEAQKGEKGYWYGKHPTEETRRKLSEKRKGEKAYWYGKKYSSSHRKNLSVSHSKNPFKIIKDNFQLEFPNQKACRRWLRENGEPHASLTQIADALHGKRSSAYGYSFEYIES